jgi:hypothetical protein
MAWHAANRSTRAHRAQPLWLQTYLWNVAAAERKNVFEQHTLSMTDVRFSPHYKVRVPNRINSCSPGR